MHKILVLLGLLLCIVTPVECATERWKLPSLLFDYRNPFFSCDDPIIKVRYIDRMYFSCPDIEFNIFPRLHLEKFYEKLYIVETEEEYRSCNATNGYAKLICNNTKSREQKCVDHGASCVTWRTDYFENRQYEPQTDYDRGKTYYFIATSFRSKENMDNRLGGSCNTTSGPNTYKLRFRIYVCTKEETENGECEPCNSLACYYKKCINKCTPWSRDTKEKFKSNTEKCYTKEHRTCTNADLAETKIEERDVEIDCPPPACDDEWQKTELIKKNGSSSCTRTFKRMCENVFTKVTHIETKEIIQETCPDQLCTNWFEVNAGQYTIKNSSCYILRERTCTEFGIPYMDKQLLKVPCPPVTAAVTNEKEGGTISLTYMIIATVGALWVGIIVGAVFWRCYHDRKGSAAPGIVSHGKEELGENGYINKSFSPQATELASVHSFDTGGPVFAPTGRLERIHSNIVEPYHPVVGRSVSFQYGDEHVFIPEALHYHTQRPRRPGKVVNRNSSATSTTHLMRHHSDVSELRRTRYSSESSSSGVSRNESMKTVPVIHEV